MTTSPPIKALSLTQPWAWLITHGFKDVENRTWRSGFRGLCYIHASKRMSRADYESVSDAVRRIDPQIVIPPMGDIELGGVVGLVEITGCVSASPSPWFFGPYAFTVKNARPLPFTACRGALGFFEPGVELPTP